MFLRRASSLLKRLQVSSPTISTCRHPNIHIPSLISQSSKAKFFGNHAPIYCTWEKNHGNFPLWIMLLGQVAISFGLHKDYILAEDVTTDGDSGDAILTDLRRIEDGSVVSNIHTSKWRIFTDNGRDLFHKGKLDEAENFFQSALQEAKKGFGERDPHVASSCNNLAELYRVRKAFNKAEPLYLEAINILEESFGPDDIRVGAALHNLGQFYLVQRKLEEARQCYERALKIKARVLGYAHTDYADTMYHLGTVLYLQGNEKDSEALIRDSIRILEEGGLGESVTCIRRLKYLAQLLIKSNRLPEAENLQRKILHALELSKGWDSLDTVTAAEGLALTLQSLGSLREAKELLLRCLDVRMTFLHVNHIQVGGNKLHLARVEMLNANRLRKVNISEARAELDVAKIHLDDSIRIARQILDSPKGNRSYIWSNREAKGTGKEEHAALVILLQSLETLGLWEITKLEVEETMGENANPVETECALLQSLTIFKEPRIRNLLLSSPDVKAEYLSCFKHLRSMLSGSKSDKQAKDLLQELDNEIVFIEAEISHNRKPKG